MICCSLFAQRFFRWPSTFFYGALVRHGIKIKGDSILITYFIFTAFFDHPHIFQTFSRTHVDQAEFQRHRRLHTWGLLGFILFGFVMVAFDLEAYMIVGAALYGSWHIMRQHWGFMRIYKALNKDFEPIDTHLDNAVFWTGMLSCFFYDYSDVHGPLVVYGDLAVWFPYVPPQIGEIGRAIFGCLVLAVIARTFIRWRQGKLINWPKLILMTTALSLHYWIFFITATPFLVAEALETAYHNLQYQGLVIHYQRRRFADVKWVVLKWLAAAMVYGLVVGVIEIYGLLSQEWAIWLFAPFTMIVVFHYYVDGIIWRTREAPELKEAILGSTSRPELVVQPQTTS